MSPSSASSYYMRFRGPTLTAAGEALNRLRVERSRTLGWLADESGITASALTQFEHGLRPLGQENLIWLLDVLDVPSDDPERAVVLAAGTRLTRTPPAARAAQRRRQEIAAAGNGQPEPTAELPEPARATRTETIDTIIGLLADLDRGTDWSDVLDYVRNRPLTADQRSELMAAVWGAAR